MRCAHAMPLPANTVGVLTDSNGCRIEYMCATVWKNCLCKALSAVMHYSCTGLCVAVLLNVTIHKEKNVLGWQRARVGERARKSVLLDFLVFNQVSRAACATAERLSAPPLKLYWPIPPQFFFIQKQSKTKNKMHIKSRLKILYLKLTF